MESAANQLQEVEEEFEAMKQLATEALQVRSIQRFRSLIYGYAGFCTSYAHPTRILIWAASSICPKMEGSNDPQDRRGIADQAVQRNGMGAIRRRGNISN